MLDFILQRVAQSCGSSSSPQFRQRCGLLAGAVGMALNLLLFAGKLCAGLLTGAISVTADAFNNLSDAAGSLATLVGFRMAGQRADARHPFGHGRMEYLAGLGVSLMILLVGVELGRSSIGKILHPEDSVLTPLAAVILIVSITVKLWMGWFNAGLGKRTESAALHAAALDARADACATSAVLLGLVISQFTGLHLDGWLGLLVAVFILKAGWSAARDTLDPLLGQPPDPQMVQDVEALILAHPAVLGIHDLVFHDYGPGRRMMSVHAEVPADGSLVTLHEVIDHIERELTERFGLEAVIHMDPVAEDDPDARRLRQLTERLVHEVGPAATIHDLRRAGADGNELAFDVVVPYGVSLTDEQIRDALTRRLLEAEPDSRPLIRVDRSHVL